MKTCTHSFSFDVPSKGAIVKFQYVIPTISKELIGVLPLIQTPLPYSHNGLKMGYVSIEVLNKKVHLATLPLVFKGTMGKRLDYYRASEPLIEGNHLTGAFMDQTPDNVTFYPYRITVILKTSA